MGGIQKLDPLLHSELRLVIMSTLNAAEEADFNYLKKISNATSGNLSVQIDKLSEAGYIEVRKEIVGRKPRTTCRITEKGIKAFEDYIRALRELLPL